MLQETKLNSRGNFKFKDYQIFESPSSGLEGGLLTAIDPDIAAVVITEESDLLIIQIEVVDQKIRIFNCYGPQEYDSKEKVNLFWIELERAVIDAKDNGCMCLIEMDANAKLGSHVIKDDPHVQSENGVVMIEMLRRQNLFVLNADDKCSGTITRHRKTIHGEENSVIDYIVVCDKLNSLLAKMIVDDERQYVLCKYATTKGVKQITESDHNILFAEFELKYPRTVAETRREIFNFKDTESQAKFFARTNNSLKFQSCFDDDKVDDKTKTENFFKTLKDSFHESFKKSSDKIKTSS